MFFKFVFAIIAENVLKVIKVLKKIVFALAHVHHSMCNEMIGYSTVVSLIKSIYSSLRAVIYTN